MFDPDLSKLGPCSPEILLQCQLKRRILCVDDYADICEPIRSILTEYEVVVAHSKTEGPSESEKRVV